MKTLTLAQIYEWQGLREEALQIYQEILKEDPDNTKARAAIHRLSGIRRHFSGVNTRMRDFFIHMQKPEEFARFERWLMDL